MPELLRMRNGLALEELSVRCLQRNAARHPGLVPVPGGRPSRAREITEVREENSRAAKLMA
jgi:hypothetical protein